MGTGIAMVFANAGIPVHVIDVNPEQVERGKKNVADTYEGQVKKGKLAADKAKERVAAVTFVGSYDEIADADLVVEAVFESMAVKKEVFAALDKAVKKDAILASNTSTLDIDEIANATSRPEKVCGLHFFAPANVMQLLEVVRGAKTDGETLNTAMALSKKLRKKGVLSGNAFGFIGNRMLFDYVREATFLLEEGATPWQVDKAIRNFGFPMGPFAMSDLSGIDVFYKISQEAPKADYRQSEIATRLYELGRYGQKTGSGFFTYEPGARKPTRDPEAERVVEAESKRLGITRRTDITDDEIVNRCMYALVNQGAQLLGDGIALRPGRRGHRLDLRLRLPVVPRRPDVVGRHRGRQENLRSNRRVARDARQPLAARTPSQGSGRRHRLVRIPSQHRSSQQPWQLKQSSSAARGRPSVRRSAARST